MADERSLSLALVCLLIAGRAPRLRAQTFAGAGSVSPACLPSASALSSPSPPVRLAPQGAAQRRRGLADCCCAAGPFLRAALACFVRGRVAHADGHARGLRDRPAATATGQLAGARFALAPLTANSVPLLTLQVLGGVC